MRVRIVKSGRWLYDDSVYSPVDIVALDFDYWYEVARQEGMLEEGELPESSDRDGFLYYVRFREAGKTASPTIVDSGACRTVEEAMSAAESRLTIEWL